MALNIIYAGTPDFAVAGLAALYRSDHNLVAVYTQPDRPSGRGKKLTPSPVKQFALEHDIPVVQPASLKNEKSLQELKSFNADVMVVTAYGLLLPKTVLDALPKGCINIHASLLPRWRGAAPIQRAIEAGDTKTGITIMQMDEGLDTGDMLLTAELDITFKTTAASLHDDLMALGASKIVGVIDAIENDSITPQQQDDQFSTYAHKMIKSEGQIDWTQSAEIIDRKIRAFYPWPGSVALKQGQSIKIHSAILKNETFDNPGTVVSHDKEGMLVSCGSGSILIIELQVPGKKRVSTKDLANSSNWLGEVFDERASS